MSQTKLIVETLKQELRKQGINYRQVAQTLGLSETSVKRLFAGNSFTLERFGCSLIMAIRPWEPKIFDELRRQPNQKTI